MKLLVQVKKLSLATMIIGLVSGILFIAFPDKCIKYISLAVGAAFIACAIVGIIAYLFDRSSAFTLAMGILLGVIGVIICIRYQQLISFIVIMIGIFVLVSGLTNLFAAFKMFAKSKLLGWTTFVLTVLTIVFGVICVTRSTELTVALVRFIGAGLVVYAVVDLIAYIEVKAMYRSLKKEAEQRAMAENAIETSATEVE